MSAPVDIAAVMQDLRRQAAMRNATWPNVLLSDLIPLLDSVDALVDAAREHHLAATRVQAERPGTFEREKAESHLNNNCYFRLRAALAKFGGAR